MAFSLFRIILLLVCLVVALKADGKYVETNEEEVRQVLNRAFQVMEPMEGLSSENYKISIATKSFIDRRHMQIFARTQVYLADIKEYTSCNIIVEAESTSYYVSRAYADCENGKSYSFPKIK